MCGICGVVAVDGSLDPRVTASVPAMNATLSHRGPDGDGFFSDQFAALGHRRLAIIDRERGAQPLSNEDGRIWIVFNGEIYNHRQLRRDLEAHGHVFRTTSDTEAIVHAYEQFGPGCVEKLEGMFAFAIYDQRSRELLLARDRIGKKPLFFALLGGALHFASEIKALRESPAWDGTIDLAQIEGYLALGYVLAPDTIYQKVKKLEPGHYLRVSAGRIAISRYWDVTSFDTDSRPESELVQDLDRALSDNVCDRLESEVPLGAFLSGGIDSGLVVSAMSKVLGADLLTCSVGFDDKAHNELEPAQLTAAHFRTRHHGELVVPRLEDVLDRIVSAFDEPFADASAIPTYYVSRSARRHVTVALSGDGGDEVFGGYDFRYVPHALECRVRAMTSGAGLSAPLRAIGSVWPRSRRLPRALRLGTFIENIGRSAADAYFADLCITKPNEAQLAVGKAARDLRATLVYEAATRPYLACPSASPVQRAQYADLKVYLPNDVLVKVDRMSMLNSLEIRCPLLDRRIVEMGFRIPTASKMPGLRAKHLLKQIAARTLPGDVMQLPKHGFSAPTGQWIRGEYAGPFAEDVLSARSWVRDALDMDVVKQWVREHRTGARDRSNTLWAIWMLERWGRSCDRSAERAIGRTLQPQAAHVTYAVQAS